MTPNPIKNMSFILANLPMSLVQNVRSCIFYFIPLTTYVEPFIKAYSLSSLSFLLLEVDLGDINFYILLLKVGLAFEHFL